MSRTYKDKPYKFSNQYKEWNTQYSERIPYTAYYVDYITGEEYEKTRYFCVKQAGVLVKKKKKVNTEHHWMSTPSAWTRLMMNRPQRRAGRVWERKVLFEDLEETDSPGVGRKPHIYYW